MAKSRDSRGLSKHNSQAFFELLQSGLWGRDANASLFNKHTDWASIYRLARIQTVSGLVFDGVMTLPPEQQPEAKLLRQWYALVLKIEQSHHQLNSVLAEIYTLYRNKGFNPILLKGQGVAQCYHNPLRRQCGDIDLYVGEQGYQQADALVSVLGVSIDRTSKSVKHLDFDYKGVVVEIHRIIAHLNGKRVNQHFAGMVNRWYPHKPRTVVIAEADVALPASNFDIVYVLEHALHHFFDGGIGLRQLCDWVLLLHIYGKKEVDKKQLEEDIKGLHLQQAWKVFAYIAVNYLGLSESEMPFYIPDCQKKAEKAIDIILKEGNFGMGSKGVRPKGYLRGKLHSFAYIASRRRAVYSVFPKESILSFIHYFKNGLTQVVKDKL